MEAQTLTLFSQWGPAGVCLFFCGWLVWWLLSKAIPQEREQSRKDAALIRDDARKDMSAMRESGLEALNKILVDSSAARATFDKTLGNVQEGCERRHQEIRADLDMILRSKMWQNPDQHDSEKIG